MARAAASGMVTAALVLTFAMALVACRDLSPPPAGGGGEEGQVAIYQIQTPHNDADAPAVGSQVFLRTVVVTAYDNYPETGMRRETDEHGNDFCVEEVGYTGGMVVQELSGGTFSGISLFNPTLVPAHMTVGPGDLVDVRGEYLEFCLAGTNY